MLPLSTHCCSAVRGIPPDMETNDMNAEGENPAAPSCAPSKIPSAAGATAVASAAEPGHVSGQLPAPYRYLLFAGRLLGGFLEQGLPGATAGVMRFLTFRGFATSPSQPPVVITYLQYHTLAGARQQHLRYERYVVKRCLSHPCRCCSSRYR